MITTQKTMTELQKIYSAASEIMQRYKGKLDLSTESKFDVAHDLAHITALRLAMADVMAQVTTSALKSKSVLRSQLDGELFLDSRTELYDQFAKDLAVHQATGGLVKPQKPTDSLVKAKAEQKGATYREEQAEAEANLLSAKYYWEGMGDCINTIKVLLKVQEEEYRTA